MGKVHARIYTEALQISIYCVVLNLGGDVIINWFYLEWPRLSPMAMGPGSSEL